MIFVATHFTFLNCARCFQTQVSLFFSVTHSRWKFWGRETHFSHLTLTSLCSERSYVAVSEFTSVHKPQRWSEPRVRLPGDSLHTQRRNRPGQCLKDEDQTLQVQVRRCCNSLTHNLVSRSSDAAEAYKRFAGAPQVTPVETSETLARKATTSAQQQQQLWPRPTRPSHLWFIQSPWKACWSMLARAGGPAPLCNHAFSVLTDSCVTRWIAPLSS